RSELRRSGARPDGKRASGGVHFSGLLRAEDDGQAPARGSPHGLVHGIGAKARRVVLIFAAARKPRATFGRRFFLFPSRAIPSQRAAVGRQVSDRSRSRPPGFFPAAARALRSALASSARCRSRETPMERRCPASAGRSTR